MKIKYLPADVIMKCVKENISPHTAVDPDIVPFVSVADIFFCVESLRKSSNDYDFCDRLRRGQFQIKSADTDGLIIIGDLNEYSLFSALTGDENWNDLILDRDSNDPLELCRQVVIAHCETQFNFQMD